MKKIFVAVLAMAGVVACNTVDTLDVPQNPEIRFANAFVENATRANEALDPSTTTESLSAFDVWGFMDNTTGTVFVGEDVTGSKGNFSYANIQYWAPGHKYYFAAVAPMNSTNVEVNTAAADKTGIGTIKFTNEYGTEDLLYSAVAVDAPATIKDQAEVVKFTFNHLLSKVKFTFTNGFANDNAYIDVKSVTMTAPKIATATLTGNWWEANPWDGHADETILEFGDACSKTPAGETQVAADERLTIPAGAEQKYTVTFEVALYMGDVVAYEGTKTATIEGVALEIGKAYNFSATLNASNITADGTELQPIVFDVEEVKEWVDANTPSDQVKDAELRAAAQFGGEVTLAEDIEILSPIVVSNDLIVNLNGKTISSKSDVFEVAAGTLTINGNGVVSAATDNGEPYCAVWAYGDAVVNINGGEYMIGYPAGDYNDLIYAKDNAVINIYGGKFYNSGKENSFVLNLKDNSAAQINVYGGEFEKFNPANNLSEGPNTNFVADGYVSEANGDWYVVSQDVIDTVEELKSALTADEKLIEVVLNSDLTYDVAAWQNDAMGGASTEVITIDLNGYTLTFNQTNSDWNNITSASGAKLVIKNGNITNSGYNDGPWNRHDLNFACPVELIDVVSDKAIALKSSATLTRVTINDANTSDTYAIWVQPKGQTVVLDGCTIDMLACTDGRGLKIDNQYLSAAEEALVTLKVSNTVFKTEEKSAILVKTTKGADITLDNVDITEVAADNVNPVWVDEATAAYFDLVTVVGGTKVQE